MFGSVFAQKKFRFYFVPKSINQCIADIALKNYYLKLLFA